MKLFEDPGMPQSFLSRGKKIVFRSLAKTLAIRFWIIGATGNIVGQHGEAEW